MFGLITNDNLYCLRPNSIRTLLRCACACVFVSGWVGGGVVYGGRPAVKRGDCKIG